RHGEAVRDGHADAPHLRDPRALAAQQGAHVRATLREVVDVPFAHGSSSWSVAAGSAVAQSVVPGSAWGARARRRAAASSTTRPAAPSRARAAGATTAP